MVHSVIPQTCSNWRSVLISARIGHMTNTPRARPRANTLPEHALETLFQKLVREHGGLPLKMAPTHIGMPDRLVLFPVGRMFLVELKTETGRLSEAQRHLHLRIERMSIEVVVLYGQAEVRAWVRSQMSAYDARENTPWTESTRSAHAAAPRVGSKVTRAVPGA